MTRPSVSNLDSYYKGVIHFHSRYSHDGHDDIRNIATQLKADGIDFCVLTDHFEDFDRGKFEEYLTDIDAVNALGETVIVPAMEAEFAGFHVIFLPVSDFAELQRVVALQELTGCESFKILAHPTKHSLPDAARFLRRHRVDAIEVWNQQADGNYFPPTGFLRSLMQFLPQHVPAALFGNDLHNVRHRISNLLLISRSHSLSHQSVVERLRRRDFTCYNRNARTALKGNCSVVTLSKWLEEMEAGRDLAAMTRQVVKKYMKGFYHLLPRSSKVAINDLKNSIKSRL